MQSGPGASRFPAAILWLPVIVLWLAAFAVAATNPHLQTVALNADSLNIPGLVEEILRNPRFRLSDWAFPPAPQLVPDTLVVLILRVAIGSAVPTILAYALVHLALLAGATFLITVTVFREMPRRLVAMAIFGALVFGLALGARGDWAAYGWPFLPFAHAGVLNLALFAYLAYERGRERQSAAWEAVGGVICFLAFLSDNLFVPYFSAPYIALLVVGARGRADAVHLLRVGAVQVAGLFAARLILAEGAAARVNLPSPNPIGRGMMMIEAYLKADAVVIGGILVATICVWSVLARYAVRRVRYGPAALGSPLGRALAFLSLAAIANVLAVASFWADTSLLSGRYLAAFQIFPPIVVSLLVARGIPRISPRAAWWPVAGTAAALALAAALVPAASVDALFRRSLVVPGMEACLDRLGLKSGLATYWSARPLTTGLDWRHEFAQLAPGTPLPFIHNNNIRSFAYEMATGRPITFNFVVLDEMRDDDVIAAFGAPASIAECEGRRLFVYADAAALTAKVQAMKPSVFWCPACTADLRPAE